MSERLSPAAQAVIDAFRRDWTDEPLTQDVKSLAAAIRAAVEQVAAMPDPNRLAIQGKVATVYQCGAEDCIYRVRREMLAIAAELEALQ
jgi:hypothetical protein